MKLIWAALAKRIDVLTERERVILFFSVLLGLLGLLDFVWLTPAQNAEQALQQKFAAQAAELENLRTQLVVTGGVKNSNQLVRDQITQTRQQIDAINAQIAQFVTVSSNGPALEQVLEEFLRRQRGLTLISTTTLKEEALAQSAPGAAAAPASGLVRHGLQLRVAGPYAELARYVKTLELALPTLRWGEMQLNAQNPVPELTLTVYVLGAHL